jgi:hypothetical protein
MYYKLKNGTGGLVFFPRRVDTPVGSHMTAPRKDHKNSAKKGQM